MHLRRCRLVLSACSSLTGFLEYEHEYEHEHEGQRRDESKAAASWSTPIATPSSNIVCAPITVAKTASRDLLWLYFGLAVKRG